MKILVLKINENSNLYPKLLYNIYDRPKYIYVIGDTDNLQKRCVSIVGSRKPSINGECITEKIAYELAIKGNVIVSGLANGIDSFAHTGALKARGRTIAVLPQSLDKIYPLNNRRLAIDILKNHGTLISEYNFFDEINKNNLIKIESNLISSEEAREEEGNGEDEYQRYQDYFRRSLYIEDLKRNYPYDDKLIEEILSLLVDTCCSRRAYIRIASDDKPAAIVKSQLMKLEYEHIQFVLDCFKENTTRVRNIRQYLLAALYNAPITIDGYYTALVHHDMYGAD